MSDIKLFQLSGNKVKELESKSVALEKSLQNLIEKHLDIFMAVKFLATEYSTGKKHGGRIDTLGIDENGCPVIIEYKRSVNENVINQGLFYLDWLLDHKAEFELLVRKLLGEKQASSIEWNNPRLICMAGDFTKYDQYAVQQMNRNIELVRYRQYGNEYLIFELVNAVEAIGSKTSNTSSTSQSYKTAVELLDSSSQDQKDLFEELKAFLIALGDDVQMKELKFYFAFKRIKNFACVEVHPQSKTVLVYLKLNPEALNIAQLGKDFARDVRKVGHYGTGDVELKIKDRNDFERAKPLLLQSYEAS